MLWEKFALVIGAEKIAMITKYTVNTRRLREESVIIKYSVMPIT